MMTTILSLSPDLATILTIRPVPVSPSQLVPLTSRTDYSLYPRGHVKIVDHKLEEAASHATGTLPLAGYVEQLVGAGTGSRFCLCWRFPSQ